MRGLTERQRAALRWLAGWDESHPGAYVQTDMSTAMPMTLAALAMRGLAERIATGAYDPWRYRITDAGRAALAEAQS